MLLGINREIFMRPALSTLIWMVIPSKSVVMGEVVVARMSWLCVPMFRNHLLSWGCCPPALSILSVC